MNDVGNEYTYDELSVGQLAEFSVAITPEFVADFARLSGDKSPLHVDPAYAAETPFQRTIAHGMIAGALFSRLVGMELPGKYCVYLAQELKFHKPVFPGTTVVVSGEVRKMIDAMRVVEIATVMREEGTGVLFVEGKALVRVLR